ncbi:MAG: hypothetical protein HYY85_05925 [Deltaproteobacteria bacterium]|nr:hypothetical protein [Deltaproteobacteria bacterium]
MPSIYLEPTEENRQIAQAIKAAAPACDIRVQEKVIAIFTRSEGPLRIVRRKVEESLGRALTAEVWKGLFARHTGEVASLSDREVLLEDQYYSPG